MERRKSLRRSSRTSLGVMEISKTFDYRNDDDADDEGGPDPPSLIKKAIRNLPIESYTSYNLTVSSQDSLDTFGGTLNEEKEDLHLKKLAFEFVKHLPAEKVQTDDDASDITNASTVPITPERRLRDKTLKPSEEDFLRNFELRQLRSVTKAKERSPEKRQLRSSDKEKYIPAKSPRLSTGDKYKKSKNPSATSKKPLQNNALPVTTVKSKNSNSLKESLEKNDKSPGLRRSVRNSSISKDNPDADSTRNSLPLKSQQKSKNSLSSSFVKPSTSKAFESKYEKNQNSDSFKSTKRSVVSKNRDEANGKTLPSKKSLSTRRLKRNDDESQNSDSSEINLSLGRSFKSKKSVIPKSPTRRSPRKVVKSKDIHSDSSEKQATMQKSAEESTQRSLIAKDREYNSSTKTSPFKKSLSTRSLERKDNENQNSDSSDVNLSPGRSLKTFTKSGISKSPTRRSPRKVGKLKDIHTDSSEKQSTLQKSAEKSTQRLSISKNSDEANWEYNPSAKTSPFKKSLSTRSLERNDNESQNSDSSDVNLSLERSLKKSTKSGISKSPTRRSPRKVVNLSDNRSTLQKSTEKSPQKAAVQLTEKKASLTKRAKADANLSSPDIRNLSKAPKNLKLRPENDESDSDFNLSSKIFASRSLNIEDSRKKRKQLEILSQSVSSRSSTKKVIGLPNTLFRYYSVKKTAKLLNRNFSVKDISSPTTVNEDINKTPETLPTPSQSLTEKRSWSVFRNIQSDVSIKENSTSRKTGITTIVIKANEETSNASLSSFLLTNYTKNNETGQPNIASQSQNEDINLIEIPLPNKAQTVSKTTTPTPSKTTTLTPSKSMETLKSTEKITPPKSQIGPLSNSPGILSPFKIPSPNRELEEVNSAIQDFLQLTKSPLSQIEKSNERLDIPSGGVEIASKDVEEAAVEEDDEDWEDQPDQNKIVQSPKPRNVEKKISTSQDRVWSDSSSENDADDLALTARRTTIIKKKQNRKPKDKKGGNKNREQSDSAILRKLAIKHFKEKTGMRHSKEVLERVGTSVEKFIDQVMDDVSAYADHAGRDTIINEDFMLYFKRIGVLNQATGFADLVLEHLPAHYRKLVPCAGAFNQILK